jgi:hypothetical protein
MSLETLLSVTAAILAAGLALSRRERRLTAQVNDLTERIRELSSRMEAADADVAHAVAQVEITENLLLDKGIADEEDLEAARRRFDSAQSASSRYVSGRHGDLH